MSVAIVVETPQFVFKKDPAERTQDYDRGLYPSALDLKVAKKKRAGLKNKAVL